MKEEYHSWPDAFQVGTLDYRTTDGDWYEDERSAIDAASNQHMASGFVKEPVAVWDRKGDIIILFVNGDMFRRV